MKVQGDYYANGYAKLAGLLAPEVANEVLAMVHSALATSGRAPEAFFRPNAVLVRPAFELYGYGHKPLLGFLWGLTPAMCAVTGRDLLPTYCYFRIYQAHDLCLVHSDRPACEHSLSLALGYSEGKIWPFEIAARRLEKVEEVKATFESDAHASIDLAPGDGALYQGVHYRHGRVTPNPNRWSAHLFMHWVDRNGPWRDEAFDGKARAPVDFQLS